MMRKLALIILPVLILAGCSQKSVYVPKSYRTKSAADEEKQKEKEGAAIVTAGETENKTNFKAPFDKVFAAAVESVQFLQWRSPARSGITRAGWPGSGRTRCPRSCAGARRSSR